LKKSRYTHPLVDPKKLNHAGMADGDNSEDEGGGGNGLFVGLGLCLAVGILAMYSMKRRWRKAAEVAGRSPSESYTGLRAPENGRLLHRRRRQESDNVAARGVASAGGVAVSAIVVNEVSTGLAPNRIMPVSSPATSLAPDGDALQGIAEIPVALQSPQPIPADEFLSDRPATADLPVAMPPADSSLVLPATADLPVAIPSPRLSPRSSAPTGDSLVTRPNTADLPVAIPLAKASIGNLDALDA
jgi:hypothetical protein